MRTSPYVPSFYFYKLADALSSSYTSLNAYRSGSIDANGNIIKPESSIDPFEYLVIKLKNIIDQLPYGMTKASLGNVLSAMNYFGEEFQNYDITKDQFDCMMEGIITLKTDNKISYLQLIEDMSVGGGGGAAGSLGTPMANSSSPTVAGFDPVLQMKISRRNPKYPKGFEVFEVDPEEFMQFKIAKNWNEVPEGENREYLRRFQRRNKGTKIAVKSLNPLNGEHDLHWIEYPAKNFMEEETNLSFKYVEMILESKKRSQSKKRSPRAKMTLTAGTTGLSEEMIKRQQENATRMFGGSTSSEGKSNRDKQLLMQEVVARNLIENKYTQKIYYTNDMEDEGVIFDPIIHIRNASELKHNEFAFLEPGARKMEEHQHNSDLMVGRIHKDGSVRQHGVELKFKTGSHQVQYVIPSGVEIPVLTSMLDAFQGKTIGPDQKIGGSRSRDVTMVKVSEFLEQHGKPTKPGSRRKDLYQAIASMAPDVQEKIKDNLVRRGRDTLESTGDLLSIIGNEGAVSAVHHRHQDDDHREIAEELLKAMKMDHTHELGDLTMGRSPSFGS